MFSRDVTTVVHEQVGPGTFQFAPAGDNYIVGASIQQSGQASDTLIQCGTTTVLRNYARDIANIQMNYHCAGGAITLSKTGNDSVFAVVSYIPSSLFPHTLIASVSGELDLARPTAYSFGHSTYIMWFGFGIVILLLAIQIGLKLFEQ